MKKTTIRTESDSWEDVRLFRCSVSGCSARLAVHMYSPRLIKDWVALLMDKAIIKKRADAVITADPERFEGHAPPSPITIMGHLRKYVGDAMKGDHKRIVTNNKKWMLSLGEPCREFLEFFQFTFNV